jgi:acetate kinase
VRVLVVNTGSSSLKWSVISLSPEATLAEGNVSVVQGAEPDFAAVLARAGTPDAVAHRVVHGGLELRATVRIDAAVLRTLAGLAAIDPLHAARALAGIRAARSALPQVPQFACFDTAFHATLPEEAARYAVPFDWFERYQATRFGFHGLSVAYAVGRAPELAGTPLRRLVVCHLGSGCSITAVDHGQSRDTTMGFTPLEGVMMSTRSGSVDPGLLLHLLRERRLSVAELDRALEKESGLLGVSGVSGDFQAVLAAADAGEARAQLAYAMFVHSIRRGLGQMLGALDGLDGLVFTGGIGEHSARLRSDVCANLAWLGAVLDPARNSSVHGDADVSGSGAKVRTLVVTAREDLVMAREVNRIHPE